MVEGDERGVRCQAKALEDRKRLLLAALFLASFSLWLLCFASSSRAAGIICDPSFCSARGVAADHETGRIFVVDGKNNRIDVFEPDGDFVFAFGWGVDTGASALETCTPASGCQKGSAGAGPGQFSEPTHIAVDNVVGSPSRHDVYVTDGHQVERFNSNGGFVNAIGTAGSGPCQISGTSAPIAVGPGGSVFVADSVAGTPPDYTSRVEKFSPAGSCEGETPIAGTKPINSLAVDSGGDLYLAFTGEGGVRRSGSESCTLDADKQTTALSLDAAGHLFAAQKEGTNRVITEYDGDCGSLRRFGYGEIGSSLFAIAAHHSGFGDVIGSEATGNVIYLDAPSPTGPILFPENPELVTAGNTYAKVKATVNTEGKPTTYVVEYLTQEAWEDQGFSFTGPATRSTGPEVVSTATGGPVGLNPVEALVGCLVATEEAIEDGECLAPGTEYRYRVVFTNADGTAASDDDAFATTGGPPEAAISVWEAGSDGATLSAGVNTHGVPVTGYFEYVEDSQFQVNGFAGAAKAPDVDSNPASALAFPAVEGAVIRDATLASLSPETLYHYRLVLDDPLLSAPVYSAEQTFETSAATILRKPEDPIVDPPPPPPPLSGFAIQNVKAKSGGAVLLALRAFGPGTFVAKATVGAATASGSRASGRGATRRLVYGRGATSVASGRLVRLAIKPRPEITELAASRRLRVKLEVEFRPSSGGTQTRVASVLVRP